jgi:hypothetical protein
MANRQFSRLGWAYKEPFDSHKGRDVSADLPDYDQAPVAEEPLLICLPCFPRARAGTLLHDLWKTWISPKQTLRL